MDERAGERPRAGLLEEEVVVVQEPGRERARGEHAEPEREAERGEEVPKRPGGSHGAAI